MDLLTLYTYKLVYCLSYMMPASIKETHWRIDWLIAAIDSPQRRKAAGK